MKGKIVSADRIVQSIHSLRGQKVMLDLDLAKLYEVSTGHLNRAVKRNSDRFPADFMFRLRAERGPELEMPIWHFKLGWPSPSSSPLCLHRTRRGDAVERSQE
jgi:hypothetical protein